MTEKEQLQARHRQEEQEIREKIKERKRRTRRLIQTGAILESVFPQAQILEPEELKETLEKILKTSERE